MQSNTFWGPNAFSLPAGRTAPGGTVAGSQQTSRRAGVWPAPAVPPPHTPGAGWRLLVVSSGMLDAGTWVPLLRAARAHLVVEDPVTLLEDAGQRLALEHHLVWQPVDRVVLCGQRGHGTGRQDDLAFARWAGAVSGVVSALESHRACRTPVDLVLCDAPAGPLQLVVAPHWEAISREAAAAHPLGALLAHPSVVGQGASPDVPPPRP